MRTNKNLLALAAGLAVCAAAVWFSTSMQAGERTYEIQPRITVPEYKTDAARAIDAYERLMDRFMDLNERNLTGISADLKGVVKKLDSIDAKLSRLSARIAGIEKALSVKQPKTLLRKPPLPEPAHKSCPEKSLPPASN